MSGDALLVRIGVAKAVVIPYEPLCLAGDGYAILAPRKVTDRE